jgi:bacterial/archaeal transporter family protein
VQTWQISALAAMVLLAAYGIATKKFFGEKQDWRAFIPLLLIVAIVLAAYYLYSGAHSEIPSETYILASIIGVIFCLSTLATVLAIQDGPVSVVIPIFSLNMVLVAIVGIVYLKEPHNIYKIVGIVLAFISIILLTIEGK